MVGSSPRLAAFERALGRDGPRSLDRHWANLTKGGSPLVERVAGDAHKLLVTFVWRPSRELVIASIFTPIADILQGESVLQQIGTSGVWFRSFSLSDQARVEYAFSAQTTPGWDAPRKEWEAYMRSIGPDPLNPLVMQFDKDPDDPDDIVVRISTVALPRAPPQPWSQVRGPLHWAEERHSRASRALKTTRSIWVYTPTGYDPLKNRYNLVIAFDGVAYRSGVPAPRIVENLVSAGRIGPTFLVLIGNASDSRGMELGHSPAFTSFLARELLPWLRRRYRLQTDASRTVLAGSSLGGLAAAYGAYRFPRLFGNVLAQSRAFGWSASRSLAGNPTLMGEYAAAPRLPIRFYLDAGKMEGTIFPGATASLLGGVRHFRDVLISKGYAVSYSEFEGGHDYSCWSGTLANGLIHLLGPR